jgi:polyferredoxin
LATRLRRISQIACFVLFAWLLARTKLFDSSSAGQLAYPVNFFFKLDPLAALINALAGNALCRGLVWSLGILIPTFFLGRFFCGWICPLGSLNHFLSGIRSESKRRKTLIASNRYKKWQTAKYLLLIAGLLAGLCRSSMVGWIDPFSLFVRSAGISILPAAASKKFYVVYQPHYLFCVTMGVAFITLLAMNFWVTRFWCRALCPLGALLGMGARWSILGLHKDAVTCNKCTQCLVGCQGGDDPITGVPWRKAECHLCLNCVAACPHGSLQFRFFHKEQEVVGMSLTRRRALAAMTTGLAAAPVLHAQTALGKSRNERLLRPPGALDETDFLSRCIRCGECMRVCPNNALQPTFAEAGLEGLWSPLMTPRIGYCEPDCVLCSEVCPTGAIRELTVRQKGWVAGDRAPSTPVRLGTAVYDRARCMPWAMATECLVCEEWCPVEPKAIYFENAHVMDREDNTRTLKRPHVDPNCCVGCGACEYACPLREHSAVCVTSIGESRLGRRRYQGWA